MLRNSFLLILSIALLGGGCAYPTAQTNEPDNQQAVPTGTELDLSDQDLAQIPSDVFERTELQRLDLSGNRLTGAPQAEIRHLQELRFLDLSDNDLTGLPAELGQLDRLEVLDVSNNDLTGLPLELGNLTQLRVLDLSGNPYSEQDLNQIASKLPNTEIRR